MSGLNTPSDKVLVMIVGPSSVGKSTVMHEVARLDTEFSYCRAFTNRPKRDGEVETYRHLTTEKAEAIFSAGEAITYFKHPTTSVIYGTDEQSYANRYNLLDTLSNTVETYRGLPFERTVAISLTTEPSAWEAWLTHRFPKADETRKKRLEEARQSIEWSLVQTCDHHWVVNQPDDPQAAAEKIINIVKGSLSAAQVPAQAEKIHQSVIRLLSYQ